MRITMLVAAMTAMVLPTIAAAPASAQRNDPGSYQDNRGNGRDDWRDNRQDRQREARRGGRQNGNQVRDWRQYRNYDYNRYEGGQNVYYADRYYRDGRYYQPRRLGRNDRIYRGGNGQYYCRRSDGTTGLIIGGIAGGLLGNSLGNGRSNTLGALLGAGAGAALGSSIDRGNVRCR